MQHLLRLECSAFLRDSNSILLTGRPGTGNIPHRSALAGRVLAAPVCAPPASAVTPSPRPPWSCAVAGRQPCLPRPFRLQCQVNPELSCRVLSPALLLPSSLSAGGHRSRCKQGSGSPLPQRLHLRRLPKPEHKRTCPHALAKTARDARRQLHAWNADRPPAQEDASDITRLWRLIRTSLNPPLMEYCLCGRPLVRSLASVCD